MIFPPLADSLASMVMIPATHSSFPRVGDKPEQQKLRRAYAGYEKGKIPEAEFREAQDSLVKEVISIQEQAGCEIVTDGMIRWYDHVSHIARQLMGFEINGLLRFFDTNYYYRQPVAGDSISAGDGTFSDEFTFAANSSKSPVKATLLGPYSMARMSQNNSSMKFERFCLRLSEILSDEVHHLADAGAGFIQIEEPAFVREPQHYDLFISCLENIARSKGKAKIILAFYFGDCVPLWNHLPDFPADFLGLDFTYSPGLMDRISADGFPGSVSFGLLDGRNTRMESADELAGLLEKALAKVDSDCCHITTSCGLEFLPRDYAIRKLELTSRVAELLNGSYGSAG